MSRDEPGALASFIISSSREADENGREGSPAAASEHRMPNDGSEYPHQYHQQQGADDNITPAGQTLRQYLSTCHGMNQAAHSLTRDSKSSSRGVPVVPEGKTYPQRIVASPDFMEKQMEVWKLLLADNDSGFSRSVLPSAEQVHDIYFAVEPTNGETTLCVFERIGVTTAVTTLIQKVLDDESVKQSVGITGRIRFYALNGTYSEWPDDESEPEGNFAGDLRQCPFCIYSNEDNGKNSLVVGMEYIPSVSPSVEQIITGLENDIIPEEDVISKVERSGTDFEPKQIVTMAITQAIDFMLQLQVRYGYIYAGEAVIFLELQEDPSVVHYFVSVPDRDVSCQDESTLLYSAVGQIFAFMIRSMQVESTTMEWIDKSSSLRCWKSGYSRPLRLYDPSPSPAPHDGDEQNDDGGNDNYMDDEDDGEEYDDCDVDIGEDAHMTIEIKMEIKPDEHLGAIPEAPQQQQQQQPPPPEDRQKVKEEDGQMRDDDDQILWIKNGRSTSGDVGERQYCTQECLLGLANGGYLDQACPNVHLHGNEHIDHIKFMKLVQDQLSKARSPSFGCVPLYLSGSVGDVFKVTLASHGYTFVAKGVVRSNASRLGRECKLYGQVKELQGTCMPVCLGIAKLDVPYMHASKVYTHFMFLSWAGRPIRELRSKKAKEVHILPTRRTYAEMHNIGLLHRGAKLHNMCYNPQQDRVMVVDFERSMLFPCPSTEFDVNGIYDIEEEEEGCNAGSSDNNSSSHGLRRVDGSENLRLDLEQEFVTELSQATTAILQFTFDFFL
ncbi:serine threonine kinase [Trichoderma arundinaceum]|uniref:Serine threonine kinase n=1 Tax=Trichoderma arundinaceum TaxID=490622 RepID=A0A395NGU5_TRIAR|nr:serine threonine kinase [Trichoderma arundinaceum]